jgi:glycosyltransferase involved in cell wall biosynthesis
MCRALTQEGVDTLIATTDADGPRYLPIPHGRIVAYQQVPTIIFRRQYSEAFKYSHPLARWLERYVGRFDVVHIHAVFSHACMAAAAACRRHSVPYVVRPLGSLDPWSLQQKRLPKRVLWYLGARHTLAAAAAIHYTTAEERRLAEEALGLRRGVVIPLGVEASLLDAARPQAEFRHQYPSLGEAPYVLVLSRLHPKKGLELLLDAFLGVTQSKEFEPWRLVIAGDGEPDYVGRLRRVLADRRAHDSSLPVVFTGWLEGQARTAALRGAGLFALVSRQENFGLAVVEAMACGVPVLVSEHVNLAREIVGATAGWVVPFELGTLRQTLAQALHDAGERARRGAAGRQLVVTRFSWPSIAAQLVELYARICASTEPHAARGA